MNMQFESAKNFTGMLAAGALVIDVRTPEEYREGHMAGSENIPLDTISDRAEEIKSRNKPVITVCRSGARSAAAAGILHEAGVNAINGGAWNVFEAQVR